MNINYNSLDMTTAMMAMQNVVKRLSKDLGASWLVSAHYFPSPDAPESITLHVSKTGWFNEDGQGIHFEAQFGARQWLKKEVPVMLHLFHSATIPGTSIKRIKVSQPFVDKNFAAISKWPGYTFRVGKYGTQPFSTTLSFDEQNFVDTLSREINRLCGELGPEIDQALIKALSD
jgi:hypothetical protein